MRSLAELWRVAGIVYREAYFKSQLVTRNVDLSNPEVVKRLAGSHQTTFYKISLAAMAVMYSIVSVGALGMAEWLFESPAERAVVAAFMMGVVMLINAFLAVMVGFMTSSALFIKDLYLPLYALGFSDREVGSIALLAFLRIYDYFIVALTASMFLLTYVVSDSVTLALAVTVSQLGIFAMLVGFQVVASLKFSRKLFTPEPSRLKSLAKFSLLAAYTTVFALFYALPSYVLANLPQLVRSVSPQNLLLVLSVVPPFPPLLLAFSAHFHADVGVFGPASAIATTLMFLLAALAVRSMLKLFKELPLMVVAHEQFEAPGVVAPPRFRVSGALSALVRKELKVAIRNPKVGMVVFMGPFMYLSYYLIYSISEGPERAVLQAVFVVAPLYIFISASMFQTDGRALEYLRSLPVRPADIVSSKAAVMLISYLSFVAVVLITAFRPVASNPIILAVLADAGGIYSGSYAILSLEFREMMSGAELRAILRSLRFTLLVGVIAGIYLGIPVLATEFLVRTGHSIAEQILVLTSLQITYLASTKAFRLEW